MAPCKPLVQSTIEQRYFIHACLAARVSFVCKGFRRAHSKAHFAPSSTSILKFLWVRGHTWCIHIRNPVAQPGFHFRGSHRLQSRPLVCGPPSIFQNLFIFHTHPAERPPLPAFTKGFRPERTPDINFRGGGVS